MHSAKKGREVVHLDFAQTGCKHWQPAEPNQGIQHVKVQILNLSAVTLPTENMLN